MSDMTEDIFADTTYGKLALQKMKITHPDFRIYSAGWMGRNNDSDVMEITGAVFRKSKVGNSEKLCIIVPFSQVTVYVTSKEISDYDANVNLDFAKLLKYPEEWDTAAYPTLESAMWEYMSCAKDTFLSEDKTSSPTAADEAVLSEALETLDELAEEAQANGNDWMTIILPMVEKVKAAMRAPAAVTAVHLPKAWGTWTEGDKLLTLYTREQVLELLQDYNKEK